MLTRRMIATLLFAGVVMTCGPAIAQGKIVVYTSNATERDEQESDAV